MITEIICPHGCVQIWVVVLFVHNFAAKKLPDVTYRQVVHSCPHSVHNGHVDNFTGDCDVSRNEISSVPTVHMPYYEDYIHILTKCG